MEINFFLTFDTSINSIIRWNFPDNLDFKGEIVGKFFLRSAFFSICNNMTAKQQIMTEPFKTYVTCIMAFSLPLTSVKLSQFYSITFFVLFTKNNKLRIKEKKIFCIHGCFSVSRYIKGGRKSCLWTQSHF